MELLELLEPLEPTAPPSNQCQHMTLLFWVCDFLPSSLEKVVVDPSPIAQLGYKTELQRNFTTFEIFGVAFSIMGLLPAIASTILYAIPAGPIGLVWVSHQIAWSAISK